jgi:ABC-type branched-subunit amino acid transport system substrate-binding protein
MIAFSASADALVNGLPYPYFFRVLPSDKYQAKALARVIAYLNQTQCIVFYSDDTYGRGMRDELTAETSLVGVTVVSTVRVNTVDEVGQSTDAPGLQSDISAAKAVGVTTFVCVSSTGVTFARLLALAEPAGLTGAGYNWVGSESVVSADLSMLQPATRLGLIAVTQMMPQPSTNSEYNNLLYQPWQGE